MQQLLLDQAQAMQDLQRLVTSLEVRLQESEMKADEAKQDQLAQPATTKKVDDFVKVDMKGIKKLDGVTKIEQWEKRCRGIAKHYGYSLTYFTRDNLEQILTKRQPEVDHLKTRRLTDTQREEAFDTILDKENKRVSRLHRMQLWEKLSGHVSEAIQNGIITDNLLHGDVCVCVCM